MTRQKQYHVVMAIVIVFWCESHYSNCCRYDWYSCSVCWRQLVRRAVEDTSFGYQAQGVSLRLPLQILNPKPETLYNFEAQES